MTILCFLLGCLCGLVSFFFFGVSGEGGTITAAIFALAAVVSFVGCFVISAVCDAIKKSDTNAWNIGAAMWYELRYPGSPTTIPIKDSAPVTMSKPAEKSPKGDEGQAPDDTTENKW